MRVNVTRNGMYRSNLVLEEIASIVSAKEYAKLKEMKVGEVYEREPFAFMSGTYEFKVERVK